MRLIAAPLLALLAGCSSLPAENYLRLSSLQAGGGAALVGGEAGGCQLSWSGKLPKVAVRLVAGECEVITE